MFRKRYVMLEQRENMPPNAGSGVSVLLHTVSLLDPLRFQFFVLDLFLFCRWALSMQYLTMEATDTSSTSTRSSALTSPDPVIMTSTACGTPCWDSLSCASWCICGMMR